ncbi:biotin--[acetyl-CoA-carboxylase] ligase [Marinomonas dokdonensis]|uniref:biotin--[acetyl-CoA-carboxylase] ligase n=1 Tax=Marinomonas dokdonensis TaxID=328224 RepID=UPI0040555097
MQAILALLSDSKFHSGEELGEALGITRAAVWKQLKKLETMGLVIHSVKGRGYRLPAPLELLSSSTLEQYGLPETVALQLKFDTESTNNDAKQYIAMNRPLPVLLATERQTQGKGRRGRQWEGGLAKNLMMSFVWRFESGPSVIEGLSLAVGVAVARVLKKVGVPNPGLKWPNDVQVDGKKLCGILLEMVADQDVCHVIIGIGMNVEMDDKTMAQVDQPWTDLTSRLPQRPSRNQILAELTQELVVVCQAFETGHGMKLYQSQWQAHDVLYNQNITVTSVHQTRHGVARGIDEKGALLMEEDGEIVALHGGEISVRRG